MKRHRILIPTLIAGALAVPAEAEESRASARPTRTAAVGTLQFHATFSAAFRFGDSY